MKERTTCRDTMACMACLIALLALSAGAGSIFDDDWTPPKSIKRVDPTPTAPLPTTPQTSGPAKPEKTGEVPPPNSTPAAVSTLAQRGVPDSALLAKSRKIFKELFSAELADHSPGARRALAKKLLGQADTTVDAPADRFVLLLAAISAGKEGKDLGICVQAADDLGAAFDVDSLRIKSEVALKMTLRADAPDISDANCQSGLKVVDELVASEDYPTATRVLKALQTAANDPKLSGRIQARAKEITALRAAADHVAPFLQKLKTVPDDAAANLAVGTYFCFTKNDWPHGLPLLAKGEKGPLASAAALDLAGGGDSEKQVAIGDAWWSMSETQTGPVQPAVRRRAAYWYDMALRSGTITGLQSALLKKRVADNSTIPGPAGTRIVNLMPLIDLERDTVAGTWKLDGGVIISDASIKARVRIPYDPPDEYDLHIQFVRATGNSAVVLQCRYFGRSFTWWRGAYGDQASGFSMVDGVDAANAGNPTRVAGSHLIENGRKYDCLIQFRKTSIVVSIDGAVVSRNSLKPSQLSDTEWSTGADGLGIGSNGGRTEFSVIEVTEVSGPGKQLPHKQ